MQPNEIDDSADAAAWQALSLRKDEQVVVGAAARMNGLCFEQCARGPERFDEVAIAVAADGRGAGVGPVEAENESHGCRLPGAVRAKESGDFARLNRERQVINGELVGVSFAEITRLYQPDCLSSLTPSESPCFDAIVLPDADACMRLRGR